MPSELRDTVTLGVVGMHCTSCVALLEEVLLEEPGVLRATVDLDAGTAMVIFDPSEVDAGRLCALVSEQGYPASLAAGTAS